METEREKIDLNESSAVTTVVIEQPLLLMITEERIIDGHGSIFYHGEVYVKRVNGKERDTETDLVL